MLDADLNLGYLYHNNMVNCFYYKMLLDVLSLWKYCGLCAWVCCI